MFALFTEIHMFNTNVRVNRGSFRHISVGNLYVFYVNFSYEIRMHLFICEKCVCVCVCLKTLKLQQIGGEEQFIYCIQLSPFSQLCSLS